MLFRRQEKEKQSRPDEVTDEIKERFGLGLCGAVAAPAGSQTGLLIQRVCPRSVPVFSQHESAVPV